MFDQARNPGGVRNIGLPPRDVVHVRGIQQLHLQRVLQQVVDRFPVIPGRLHTDDGDLLLFQPLA